MLKTIRQFAPDSVCWSSQLQFSLHYWGCPKSDQNPALTHLPLDNMAAVLADDIFKCIYLTENYGVPI